MPVMIVVVGICIFSSSIIKLSAATRIRYPTTLTMQTYENFTRVCTISTLPPALDKIHSTSVCAVG